MSPITGTYGHGLSKNMTGPLLAAIIRGCAILNGTSFPVDTGIIEQEKRPEEDVEGAVLYIVTVLVFYSVGIVTLIIKYLKRNERKLEEDRALDDFFRSMPVYDKLREKNRVNSVAIQAFHALTSGSDDGCNEDAFTDDEEGTRVVTATIHEVEDCESKGVNDACPY